MKLLWDGVSDLGNPPRDYATHENAVKAAQKILGDMNIRVIIAATKGGRFFPVALGQAAMENGVHFKMCVVA